MPQPKIYMTKLSVMKFFLPHYYKEIYQAICAFYNDNQIFIKKIKLQKQNTSFQTELLATEEAIICATSTNFNHILIITDRLSGLTHLIFW